MKLELITKNQTDMKQVVKGMKDNNMPREAMFNFLNVVAQNPKLKLQHGKGYGLSIKRTPDSVSATGKLPNVKPKVKIVLSGIELNDSGNASLVKSNLKTTLNNLKKDLDNNSITINNALSSLLQLYNSDNEYVQDLINNAFTTYNVFSKKAILTKLNYSMHYNIGRDYKKVAHIAKISSKVTNNSNQWLINDFYTDDENVENVDIKTVKNIIDYVLKHMNYIEND